MLNTRITIGLFLVGVILTSTVDAQDAKHGATSTPNVVIILADDMAWTDYGWMGHSVIKTPRLDQLARESLVFTRGYVPTSLCRASLMSLISGRYPHQHMITGNDPPKGTDRRAMLRQIRATPTIPKRLAELPSGSGYVSLQTGKWWEGNYAEGGFTSGMTHGDPSRGGRHGDEGLKIGRGGMGPIAEFLDQSVGKPFFLWYAPMLPHQPHNPPERLLAKYRDRVESPHVAKYYAMCEWFDETCGQLLDELDRRKLSDNTLVVYLADNGWIQDPIAARFAPRSKRSPYDGGLRTPIMLRWKGRITPRRDDQRLATSLDVAPTIYAAAGLPPDPGLPGVDLLSGNTTREALFGAIFEHDQPNLDDPAAGLLFRWCVAGDWKLILPNADQPPELYRITSDPREEHDLADREAAQVLRMRNRIEGWWNLKR